MEKFRDTAITFEERAADLLSRMTLEEKISWCGAWPCGIDRLGIPAYHFANEASHGINAMNYISENAYNVTSYPTCLAMSQSWDPQKIHQVTRQISDEARAAHNLSEETLNYWCPTINLSKDPRNGRSDENFGEDPYLSGKLAAAYIRGFQGADEDGKYIKAVATPKHFLLNSSENNRNTGSSFADERTIREYYGQVFERAVKEGGAQSVMISYNRVNGVPSGVNHFALQTLLREEWGFDGFVCSDMGAVAQMYKAGGIMAQMAAAAGGIPMAHMYFNSLEEACAASLIEGCDQSIGNEHLLALKNAFDKGLITEDQIDHAVLRNLTPLFREGIFDAKGSTPWDSLGAETMDSEEHKAMAVDMANDSIVLLKNEKQLLPIRTDGLKKILVVGPNAAFTELGGYSAGAGNAFGNLIPSVDILTLDGVREAVEGSGIRVDYEKGWCSQKEAVDTAAIMAAMGIDMKMIFMSLGVVPDPKTGSYELPEISRPAERVDPDRGVDNMVLAARALERAKEADLVIFVAGTDSGTAAEGNDRQSIALPAGQSDLLRAILAVNPNTITVLTVMGTIGDPVLDETHTLVLATHAGQAQGRAIANVLFGKVNPNGKLTATWYKDDSQLADTNDYGIRKADTLSQKHGRTYWYFEEEPRFPFGYGLSYTSFAYSNLKLEESEIRNGGALKVSVDVTNTGARDGKEIVELYITRKSEGEVPGAQRPIRQLKGFRKVEIKAGETKRVDLEVPLTDITFWNYFYKKMVIEEGAYELAVGPNSAELPCKAEFHVVGTWNAGLSTVYADLDKTVYEAGEEGTISVTATLEDTSRLDLKKYRPVYASSDEKVARVDENGRITACGSGTALISATVTYQGKCMTGKQPVAVR